MRERNTRRRWCNHEGNLRWGAGGGALQLWQEQVVSMSMSSGDYYHVIAIITCPRCRLSASHRSPASYNLATLPLTTTMSPGVEQIHYPLHLDHAKQSTEVPGTKAPGQTGELLLSGTSCRMKSALQDITATVRTKSPPVLPTQTSPSCSYLGAFGSSIAIRSHFSSSALRVGARKVC